MRLLHLQPSASQDLLGCLTYVELSCSLLQACVNVARVLKISGQELSFAVVVVKTEPEIAIIDS